MEKTNFTKLRPLAWMMLPVMMLFFSSSVLAQPIACNNNVQVSVDPTPDGSCEVALDADMILEGDPAPNTNYLLQVMQGVNILYSGVNVVVFNASSHLGQTLVVKVTNQTSGNSCWGSIKIEDKAAPVCYSGTVTLSCTQDYNNVAFPDADDNCDLFPDVQLTDVNINTANQCTPGSNNGGVVVVTRTFIAIDDSGNESATCTQTINIERPNNIDFPNDITWECDQYASHANITAAAALHPTVAALQVGTQTIDATGISSSNVLANTGSGLPSNTNGTYCNYAVSHSDQTVATCGNTFKIIRTWTVLDWCTGTLVTSNNAGEDNIQIVKVVDQTAPVITMAPYEVSANITGVHPQPCKSQDFLPAANVSDNCNTFTVRIFTPVGEAIYINGSNGNQGGLIPAPGLPLGVHTILYQATDICGNVAELNVSVTVVDDIAPTAICDEITEVALTSNGMAIVPASVFDDGSYDNCCMDEFLVRRMNGDCDGLFDDFGPTAKFCCTDIDDNPIMVVFRAVDCYGNYNDCMVEVQVSDKIPPIVSCPPNATINCDQYLDNYAAALAAGNYDVLNVFGTATYFDNCATNVDLAVTVNINTCQEGTITRKWTVTDDVPNAPAMCTQTIFVNHVSDWVVEFPADVTAQCVDGQLPPFGEPEIFHDECELIGVSYEDQYFYVVVDACYKIVRHYTVINWCIYEDFGFDQWEENGHAECNLFQDWDGDGDFDCRTFRDGWNTSGNPGTPDGYIDYDQTIKIVDNEAPIFNVDDQEVCIEETDCDTNVTLPTPDVTDCSTGIEIIVTSNLPNPTANQYVYNNVPPGTYTATYEVTDNCGNTSYDEITITVVDCKKPTPYCENGLVIEIMQTGMIDIWAVDFDAGSFDNCPGDLKLSFSPDVNDTQRIYTCDDLGNNTIQLWVTDAAGNQDFCETFVQVQDNMNACGSSNTPDVAGAIASEADQPVQDVTVELSGNGMFSVTTDASGSYMFTNLVAGNDYSVTPNLDVDHDNGVSTYDLVLITKHILGIQPLDSPYKIIAADANHTNSVTTTDMVEIRKVILGINQEFPANTSWRFVDADYVFPNPQNPFTPGFPEVINFNNLTSDQLFADFVAVKVGDVNGTATTNADQGAEDRAAGIFFLNTADVKVQSGKQVSVDFTASDYDVLGYQFTLNFDANALQLVDVVEGVALEENFGLMSLENGIITTSWNGEAAKDAVLFTLVFQASADAQLSELLTVDSRVTKAEAYNSNGQAMDVALQFGNTVAVAGFELYQNTPNPFKGETTIGFNLPEAANATLKIMDVSGKLLKVVDGEFAKGYNQVSIDANELPGVGVLYYTLETAEYTATKKMIIVK